MQQILLIGIFLNLRFRCQNHGVLHYSFSIHLERIKFVSLTTVNTLETQSMIQNREGF